MDILKKMGSTEIENLGFRESWTFIGVKGDTNGLMSEMRKPRGKGQFSEVSKEFLAIRAPIEEYI